MKKLQTNPPDNWDRSGLPAWTYFNEELFELEAEELFRSHWQLVCHVNDLPDQGSFITFDLLGERALIIRDGESKIRAFHNVCRHRGSRVVEKHEGKCSNVIICPFHGWSFNLDGTLRGAAKSSTLPYLDPHKWGLKPLEMDIWLGFIFIRFKTGPQPSISEILATVVDEVSLYRPSNLLPTTPIQSTIEMGANWKAIRDVDNEGYHVSRAHPSLQDLYGRHYLDEPFINGISRSYGFFNEGQGHLWSIRYYKKLIKLMEPPYSKLPKAWFYLGIFPNSVLGFYPDSVMFYQDIPLTVNKSQIRSSIYRHEDETRIMRLARYLSTRIDEITFKEDIQLTLWTYEAMKSSAYDGIILSDLEYGVRSYHDALRKIIPVMCQNEEPLKGTLNKCNMDVQAGMF